MAGFLKIDLDSMTMDDDRIQQLIDMTPMEGIHFSDIIRNVNEVWSLVMKGAHKKDLHVPLETEGLEKKARELIINVATTRKRSNEKFIHGDELFFTSEGLRWATPQSAAEHCSRRIGRDLAMDVTCGQGGQVLSLADSCRWVIGIDMDPLNCLITILNCRSLGKNNVAVVHGDCLDPEIIKLADNGCAVFSDPARPPGAVERTFEEIIPDPRKIKAAYDGVAGGMCFEIPPYISLDKVDFNCEYEYLSIDGRVNRLNIYTGDLVLTERSAVVLPEGNVLKGVFSIIKEMKESQLSSGNFIYEVDPAVVRAGLEGPLSEELDVDPDFIHLDNRRCMLSTIKPLSSAFLKQGYKILANSVKDVNLVSVLKELKAGSVTLRFGVDPKDYWKTRRSLESKLDGNIRVDLFKGKDYLILQRV
jgi:hypothetical protein